MSETTAWINEHELSSLDDFLTVPRLRAQLEWAVLSDRPRTLRVNGPEHVGKSTLALLIARSFLCNNASVYACSCKSCEMVRRGIHPDLHILGTEEHQTSIGIEEVRGLIDSVVQTGWGSGKRVAVIVGADRLTIEASNSLLKTLEEPPVQTTIILTAQNQYRLLPTIRSRVPALSLPRLNDAILTSRPIASSLDRHEIIDAARGLPGRFVQLCRLSSFRKQFHDTQEELSTMLAAIRCTPPRHPWDIFDTMDTERLMEWLPVANHELRTAKDRNDFLRLCLLYRALELATRRAQMHGTSASIIGTFLSAVSIV